MGKRVVRNGAADVLKGGRLKLLRAVAAPAEVEPDLADERALAGKLCSARRIRGAAPAVGKPPGMEARSHAHVVKGAKEVLGGARVGGRDGGVEKGDAAPRRLPRDLFRIAHTVEMAVHVHEAPVHGAHTSCTSVRITWPAIICPMMGGR